MSVAYDDVHTSQICVFTKTSCLCFRSRSTDEETDLSFGSGIIIGEEQSLEDVAEDPESGESETANEVEVSERALKFKISTESSVGTGRKSYPGSRKGSRERVQHFNSSDLARMMQKGKLRSAGFSFDQHCYIGTKKLSFDTPEFLDEYATSLKKRLEESGEEMQDTEGLRKDGECVVSKETLNLNKRNSDHSIKVLNVDEKKSILKCSDNKSLGTNANNIKKENLAEDDIVRENNRKNSNSFVNIPSDNVNSIASEKDEIKKSESPIMEAKNSRSILSRIRQFTDRLSLSMDKNSKVKHLRNNNSTRNSFPQKIKNCKKLSSPCCRSLEEVAERKTNTLPKIKNKKSWKFLVVDKDKEKLEGWASEAAVNKIVSNESDNQSLPSTSQLQSNCASPKTRFEKLEILSMKDFKIEPQMDNIAKEEYLIEKEKEGELI